MPDHLRNGFALTPLRRVSGRLCAHDWVWARENAEAIERDWQRRVAERPEMFDGPVLLSQGCTIANGGCEVQFFETRYSCFIASRDHSAKETGVFNAFSAIVPRSADGGLLLGEMAAHTANAAQIYFPCGTPDREDVREGGVVDLAGSAGREFEEETGLTLPKEAARAPWVLVRGNGQLAFLRPVSFAESAEALVERAEAHLKDSSAPELTRMVVTRGAGDLDPAQMPGFARAYLESVF